MSPGARDMSSTKKTRDNPATHRQVGVNLSRKISISKSRQQTTEQSASNSSLCSSSSQETTTLPGTVTGRKLMSTPAATNAKTTTAKTHLATAKRGEKVASTSTASPTASQQQQQLDDGPRTIEGSKSYNNVIDSRQRQQRQPPSSSAKQRHAAPTTTAGTSTSSAASRHVNKHRLVGGSDSKRRQIFRETSRDQSENTSSSSQEMTTASTTTLSSMRSDTTLTPFQGGNIVTEQETTLDSRLGSSHNSMKSRNCDDTDDDECTTLLESPKMQPTSATKEPDSDRPVTSASSCAKNSQLANSNSQSPLVLYHDDEEINYRSSSLAPGLVRLQAAPRRISSTDDDYEDDDLNDLLSHGAALTMADDDQITTLHSEEISFVVYPLGCCEFDETQLVSATSTRAIQKCILRLSNKPTQEETMCWGLGQSQPILMRLLEDHIQFTDINSHTLLRSQPIQTIKTWAVDDDNNFAFVVEENSHQAASTNVGSPTDNNEDKSTLDYALLNGPTYMCYVFRSIDDDDMSCRVAAKLNEEINRYREQMSNRVSKSTRLQQMTMSDYEQGPKSGAAAAAALLFGSQRQSQLVDDQTTDLDADDLDDLVEVTNELSIGVKYIGKVQVPRPVGIDVLNIAIDKCLADASVAQTNRMLSISANGHGQSNGNNATSGIDCDKIDNGTSGSSTGSPLIDAKLHVSPSSVIVENVQTGEIIVECRIRFLTFMGISRRDIRWCGFIMQNTTTKTFVAHCFECYPTAGPVCEAIQVSCSKMYEKIVKGQRSKQQDATTSIMPNGSKIRDTLAKTLSRIKLTPII